MVFISEHVPAVAETQVKETKLCALNIPPTIKKENVLLTANQNSMVGILAELSVLAQYSGELYSNLIKESSSLCDRITTLSKRVSFVQQNIVEVDKLISSTTSEMNCSNPRGELALPQPTDAQFFTVDTRTPAITARYTKCFAPPILQKMDPYMDNGQKCLELYTNPRFFLDEWIQEQMKLRAAAKEERRKRREQRKKERGENDSNKANKGLGPAKPKKLERIVYDPNTGEKIVLRRDENDPTPSPGPTSLAQSTLKSSSGSTGASSGNSAYQNPPPPTQTSPSQPPQYQQQHQQHAPTPQSVRTPTPVAVNNQAYHEPAAPLPPQDYGHGSVPAPVRKISEAPNAPPPPPNAPAPPPPPAFGAAPPPPPPPTFELGAPSSGGIGAQIGNVVLKSVGNVPAPKKVDARSDLLVNIRSGIALKSAATRTIPEKEAVKEEKSSVAAILSRRIAIAPSDSEDESEDEEESEWD